MAGDAWSALKAVTPAEGQGSTFTPGTTHLWISTPMLETPPSLNDLPLDSRSPVYRRRRAQWMRDVSYLMSEHGNVLPKQLTRVYAMALLTFTTKRRRDEGNYRSHMEKWLGDVLQQTNRLADDTPDYYRFGSVQFVLGDRESTTLLLQHTLRDTPQSGKGTASGTSET